MNVNFIIIFLYTSQHTTLVNTCKEGIISPRAHIHSPFFAQSYSNKDEETFSSVEVVQQFRDEVALFFSSFIYYDVLQKEWIYLAIWEAKNEGMIQY